MYLIPICHVVTDIQCLLLLHYSIVLCSIAHATDLQHLEEDEEASTAYNVCYGWNDVMYFISYSLHVVSSYPYIMFTINLVLLCVFYYVQ